jgi:short-subunit dehydrogenase
MWTKYDYLCTNCDALIEVTAQVKPQLDADCICGNGSVINIGTSLGNAPIITDVTDITPIELEYQGA